MAVKLFLGCFLCLLLKAHAQEAAYSLNWENGTAVRLNVAGSNKSLYVRRQGAKVYVAGRQENTADSSSFSPLVPFTNGLSYDVFTNGKLLLSFTPIAATHARPEVARIHPRAGLLPENFLKFYFVFSQPMEVGKVYEHLHLFEDGEEIEDPFIPLSPELWDRSHQVLTVWIDPGRVKRGLGRNQRLGAVLKKGKSYRMVLDSMFRNASGIYLSQQVEKSFLVSARDERSPSVEEWQVSQPMSGTKDSLLLSTAEAMDYSVVSMISLYKDEELISGSYYWKADQVIQFQPYQRWRSGRYFFQIDARAEDLAGNNFDRLFDTDLKQGAQEMTRQDYRIPFSIK